VLACGAAWAAPPASPARPIVDEADEQALRQAPLEVYSFTLKHQRATEALAVVQPMLSPRGSLELKPAENTVVVRDAPTALARVIPILRRFDHPPKALAIEVMIVRAQRAAFSPIITQDNLPEALERRLRELLPFSSYAVIARTELPSREGEGITYEIAEGYVVNFRPGVLVDGEQLKLYDFRLTPVSQGVVSKALFQGTLNLRLERPLALGLAAAEGSEKALVVVVTPRLR
ncbi:MAG TPA: secretin N-terminal domain-containing protein, partial [Thermoanaerobaculia bacterium]|nr:secretin N-terminal domain-containing protein [Thermoanaerobaculia bacterium]